MYVCLPDTSSGCTPCSKCGPSCCAIASCTLAMLLLAALGVIALMAMGYLKIPEKSLRSETISETMPQIPDSAIIQKIFNSSIVQQTQSDILFASTPISMYERIKMSTRSLYLKICSCFSDTEIQKIFQEIQVVTTALPVIQIHFVSRTEWMAKTPEQLIPDLQLPVPFVVVLQTDTEPCQDEATCSFQCRYLQTLHMEKWRDIGYNFLIGGNGLIYEGRGWQKKGKVIEGGNSRSITIAFIGTFDTILPAMKQIMAGKLLIALGVDKGFIEQNYTLFGHRQLSNSKNPGRALFRELKTWVHWACVENNQDPNDPISIQDNCIYKWIPTTTPDTSDLRRLLKDNEIDDGFHIVEEQHHHKRHHHGRHHQNHTPHKHHVHHKHNVKENIDGFNYTKLNK